MRFLSSILFFVFLFSCTKSPPGDNVPQIGNNDDENPVVPNSPIIVSLPTGFVAANITLPSEVSGNVNFKAVSVLNNGVVYISGSKNVKGVLLKSEDGGQNFEPVAEITNSILNLSRNYFLDSNTGYLTGHSGEVYYTPDGGVNHSLYEKAQVADITSMSNFGSTNVAISDQAKIYSETDGAKVPPTWAPLATINEITRGEDIQLVTAELAYGVGYNVTDNVYTSFFIKCSGITTNVSSCVAQKLTNYKSYGRRVKALSFANEDVGYVVVGSSEIWKTDNGGQSFSPIDLPAGISAKNVYALDGQKLIVTSTEVVLVSGDRGINWDTITVGADNKGLVDIAFSPDKQIGFVVGIGGEAYYAVFD